jgi:hypothetical protein
MSDQAKRQQQLIAKCWADETFKQRLISEPARTLAQEGIEIPEGVQVKVLADSEHRIHLVIPMRPNRLVDEEIGVVTAGTYTQWGCSR